MQALACILVNLFRLSNQQKDVGIFEYSACRRHPCCLVCALHKRKFGVSIKKAASRKLQRFSGLWKDRHRSGTAVDPADAKTVNSYVALLRMRRTLFVASHAFWRGSGRNGSEVATHHAAVR